MMSPMLIYWLIVMPLWMKVCLFLEIIVMCHLAIALRFWEGNKFK